MSTIRNRADLERHARQRDQIFVDAQVMGAEIALDITAQRMRETTAFRDLTGNLRSSIGHGGPIAATAAPRGLGKASGKVQVRGDVIVAILPVGMAYASDVDELRNFTVEAIAESPAVFERQSMAAAELAIRQIEAL